MDRLIFVVFSLATSALTGVCGSACDDENAKQYGVCTKDLATFLFQTNDSSVALCLDLYNKAATCFETRRGNCSDGPVTKWLEYTNTGSRLHKIGTSNCNNLAMTRTLRKCGTDEAQFGKCRTEKMKASMDFCGLWNAVHPCYKQLYAKCSDEQHKHVDKNLEILRPEGCKGQGTKTSVGLVSLALPSVLIVLYGLLI